MHHSGWSKDWPSQIELESASMLITHVLGSLALWWSGLRVGPPSNSEWKTDTFDVTGLTLRTVGSPAQNVVEVGLPWGSMLFFQPCRGLMRLNHRAPGRHLGRFSNRAFWCLLNLLIKIVGGAGILLLFYLSPKAMWQLGLTSQNATSQAGLL